MIEARIRKSFPEFSLDLEITAGNAVTVLFGPSGAGKTLTLDCIAGFVRPEDGRILLDGQVLYDGAGRVCLPPQARHTGYVFQNYALFPHMSLTRNLEFAAAQLPKPERQRKVKELIERFRLTEVADRRPFELSGGQKQRCSIARALVGEPRLLLLDEPARGLDATLRGEFYAVLRQVRAEFGTPILLVTHDLEECFELGDEMTIVSGGRVVQTGSPRAIANQPANVEVARLLGLYNLLAVEIVSLDPEHSTSRVRFGESELHGPFYPGKQIGDRAWLYVRPEDLKALPRNGRPGPNQIAAKLLRVVEKPRSTRLEFAGGLAVETSSIDRSVTDWVIEFPAEKSRVL